MTTTKLPNPTVSITPGTSNVYAIMGGTASGTFATNGSYSWTQSGYNVNSASVNVQSALKVSGDADVSGRLTVQGHDIVTLLEKINQRLCILVPDPQLLDKYSALQEAYDYYKTLEALCIDTNVDRTKK